MRRFEFPLEKVLRWRSVELAVEEARLKQLAQEQIRLQIRASELASERAKLAESPVTLVNPRGQDLQAMVAYGAALRHQMAKLAEQRTRSERELAKQKKRYNDAKQRVRLLEQLRARKMEEWRHEEALELEGLAAESYLSNWNRRPGRATVAGPGTDPTAG